jgi:hypothetical protein
MRAIRRAGLGLVASTLVAVPLAGAPGASGSDGDGRDCEYSLLPRTEPARIVRDPDPAFNEYVMNPIKNGWAVSSHRRFTFVFAGGDELSTRGRFVIWHELYHCHHLRSWGDLVNVRDAEWVKIVEAPLGRDVVHWAQRRGKLHFTSKVGPGGVLDLRDNSVTLDPVPEE